MQKLQKVYINSGIIERNKCVGDQNILHAYLNLLYEYTFKISKIKSVNTTNAQIK